MSFQAVTWAIAQKAGGPRAKATLWSIANYANEHWCAWPAQKLICEESEQSPDAIQKQIPNLVERGLVRRIPLRFSGRRTVDFFILQPSVLFDASLAVVEPYLPRGCLVDVSRVAATSGNAAAHVAAVEPPTLPLDDGHVAALQRQQEPVMEPVMEPGGGGSARTRAAITDQAFDLAEKLAAICGFTDPKAWPAGWCGAPLRAQMMLDRGWQVDLMLAVARELVASKIDGAPFSLSYFDRPFARAHALLAKPLPNVVIDHQPPTEIVHATVARHNDPKSGLAAIDRVVDRFAAMQSRDAAQADEDPVQRLPPRSVRGS